MTNPRELRSLAAAISKAKGAERMQLLDRLAATVQTIADEHLLEMIENRGARRLAQELEVSRQAIYQRAHRARNRLGGGS